MVEVAWGPRVGAKAACSGLVQIVRWLKSGRHHCILLLLGNSSTVLTPMKNQMVQLKKKKVHTEKQCFRDVEYLLSAYLVPGTVEATLQILSYFILMRDFTIHIVETRTLKQLPSDL